MATWIQKWAKRLALAWRVLSGKTGVMTVSAVLIHRDGTKEDLGVLAKGNVDMTPEGGPRHG